MQQVIAVAPHPDDETLGCGASLLKHQAQGDCIHWLIVTHMSTLQGYSNEQIIQREQDINQVQQLYGFTSVHRLNFPPAGLDTVPKSDLTLAISRVFQTVQPDIVYLPFKGDAHSDHAITADATVACCKNFRQRSVKRILAYETLSETEFGLSPDANGFRPNVFIDCSQYINAKLTILEHYQSELADFPFPRSLKAVEALAHLRGSTAGCEAAEAFMLLRELS